ncbi:hypothetical protein OG394_11605 [Kribbella sp. NBC_01245]|uniref:hypothetical protein n=1 Tax=Kribbella sp. NBC_01245 TaxID=2903578 RepID=UPI002E285AF8|nr:hypothetical protein [Kribbella sp. NBC_01245]
MEIAGDESGFSGTNMLDPDSRVFSHATVELDLESAARCVEVARRSVPYAGDEFKANHLLRVRQRPTLAWLLGADGPIYGKARVHLVDKTFFVAVRMVDVLIAEPTYSAGTSLDPDGRAMAFALHREGPRVFGTAGWDDVLMAFTTLMRAKYYSQVEPLTDELFQVLQTNDTAGFGDNGSSGSGTIVEGLLAGRDRIEPYMRQVLDERSTLPPLEPLMPALVETALTWGADGRRVSVIHDEQSSLTPHRLGQIELVLAQAWPGRGGPLLSLRQVDSRTDPRVQVADLLAGAARRIATNELCGEGDPELAELLSPYIDSSSIWADEGSWARLTDRQYGQGLSAASW